MFTNMTFSESARGQTIGFFIRKYIFFPITVLRTIINRSFRREVNDKRGRSLFTELHEKPDDGYFQKILYRTRVGITFLKYNYLFRKMA